VEIPQLQGSGATNVVESGRTASRDEAAIRQMATEFEALLLNQLTATLNKTDDEEGGLFSDSGGGLSLSRQMFSEQLAKTMSQSGGIGLADLIMSQLGQKKTASSDTTKHATPLSAMRQVKNAQVQAEKPGLSPAPAQEAPGRFIASEAALATRPRRVHPVRPEPVTNGAPTEAPRSPSVGPKLPEIHRTNFVSLRLPIRGAIRSVFGPRRDPINGRPRFHKGIDIAAPQGTPIQAAAAGTVVFAGRNKGYGNMVMIEHADGRRTLYAHAKSLFVKVGSTVSAGQTIAAVGSTGHSTGPHVHFEIRVGDQAINPLTALTNDFLASRR